MRSADGRVAQRQPGDHRHAQPHRRGQRHQFLDPEMDLAAQQIAIGAPRQAGDARDRAVGGIVEQRAGEQVAEDPAALVFGARHGELPARRAPRGSLEERRFDHAIDPGLLRGERAVVEPHRLAAVRIEPDQRPV